MAKVHGDFGDMTRYDLAVVDGELLVVCQDCERAVGTWPLGPVNLAAVNKVAAEHETSEEQPQ